MSETVFRNPDRFASDFTRWVYDIHPHRFLLSDIDAITFQRGTNIFRVIESKNKDEYISAGQKVIFGLFSEMINSEVADGRLSKSSGVFTVVGSYPYEDGFEVYRFGMSEPSRMSREEMIDWLNNGSR